MSKREVEDIHQNLLVNSVEGIRLMSTPINPIKVIARDLGTSPRAVAGWTYDFRRPILWRAFSACVARILDEQAAKFTQASLLIKTDLRETEAIMFALSSAARRQELCEATMRKYDLEDAKQEQKWTEVRALNRQARLELKNDRDEKAREADDRRDPDPDGSCCA